MTSLCIIDTDIDKNAGKDSKEFKDKNFAAKKD